jgi:hypothetical protein
MNLTPGQKEHTEQLARIAKLKTVVASMLDIPDTAWAVVRTLQAMALVAFLTVCCMYAAVWEASHPWFGYVRRLLKYIKVIY